MYKKPARGIIPILGQKAPLWKGIQVTVAYLYSWRTSFEDRHVTTLRGSLWHLPKAQMSNTIKPPQNVGEGVVYLGPDVTQRDAFWSIKWPTVHCQLFTVHLEGKSSELYWWGLKTIRGSEYKCTIPEREIMKANFLKVYSWLTCAKHFQCNSLFGLPNNFRA